MEIVDTIVDDVLAAIERSILLVDLVRNDEVIGLTDLVRIAPWAPGLKRDDAWKRAWLADTLSSMHEAGISLKGRAAQEANADGKARFRFDEIAFAVDTKRIELTWRDFKKRSALGAMLSIVDEETESSLAEASDYGSVRMAKIALRLYAARDAELTVDLHRLGGRLSVELADVLESMHVARPTDGYPPIARHNVFWTVVSDYEGLRLDLDIRDPFLDTDERLSSHLRDNYPSIKSTSRPMIVRRRKALHNACEERIVLAVREVVAPLS